jgi:hypothetical protein
VTSYTAKAERVLAEAVAELQNLAQLALRDNDYSSVAAIASLAERLYQVTSAHSRVPVNPSANQPRTESARRRKVTASQRTPSVRYPTFRRDGDKLVKIGWSKKSREEYEHRAPMQAVTSLLSTITKKVGAGEYFRAPDVFPLVTDTGEQLPDYQGYLVLKWLHGIGLIQKKGRDLYALTPGKDHTKEIDSAWEALESV